MLNSIMGSHHGVKYTISGLDGKKCEQIARKKALTTIGTSLVNACKDAKTTEAKMSCIKQLSDTSIGLSNITKPTPGQKAATDEIARLAIEVGHDILLDSGAMLCGAKKGDLAKCIKSDEFPLFQPIEYTVDGREIEYEGVVPREVQMDNGSKITVYYQKATIGEDGQKKSADVCFIPRSISSYYDEFMSNVLFPKESNTGNASSNSVKLEQMMNRYNSCYASSVCLDRARIADSMGGILQKCMLQGDAVAISQQVARGPLTMNELVKNISKQMEKLCNEAKSVDDKIMGVKQANVFREAAEIVGWDKANEMLNKAGVKLE
jgi:hypothetical protein